MVALRRLKQPGRERADRVVSAVGAAESLEFTLQPGLTLNAAISGPLLKAGLEAAQVELSGGSFGPLTYVIPAAACDPGHAAWYSALRKPEGTSRLEAANVTFGRRDGGPFTHCHAFFTEADGSRRGGHVMPLDTVVAAPVTARAYGAREVGVGVEFDPETNFTLFTPRALAGIAPARRRIAFARVRPNTDIATALEDLCRQHGFAAGVVRGGVGSLVGARFADAPEVTDYATEVMVRSGVIRPGADGDLEAALDVSLVGMSGCLAGGRLLRGENPVCITFEIAVEETAP